MKSSTIKHRLPYHYLLCSIASMLAAAPAYSAVVINEPFNYTTGPLGTQAATGAGLTGAWGNAYNGTVSGSSAADIIDTFTYSTPIGYAPAPSGNQYFGTGGDTSFAKTVGSIDTGTNSTTYFSFIFQLGTLGTSSGSFAQVGLSTIDPSTNKFLAVGKVTSGSSNFGLQLNNVSGIGTVPISINTPYLVVGKFVTDSVANDVLTASIYTSASTLPTSDPATWDATVSTATTFTLDALRIAQGGNITDMKVDQIRFGDTLSAVTVPEPSVALSLVGGVGILLGFRRSRCAGV